MRESQARANEETVEAKRMALECFVCLRIRPEDVLKWAHLVFVEDAKVARVVGLKASEIIRQSYILKRTFLCGKGTKFALAGLFYLLAVMHDVRKTQRDIAISFSISEVSVRTNFLRWLKTFPQFFPDFNLTASRGFTHPQIVRFKGKRVNAMVARKGG